MITNFEKRASNIIADPFVDMFPIGDGKHNDIIRKPNGDLEGEYEFFGVERNGLNKWYYRHNVLALEQNFKNGVLDGVYREYYRNGNLMIAGQYKNGVYDGDFTMYSRDSSWKLSLTAEKVIDKEVDANLSFCDIPFDCYDVDNIIDLNNVLKLLKMCMRIFYDFYTFEQLEKPTFMFNYSELIEMYNRLNIGEIKNKVKIVIDDLNYLNREITDNRFFYAQNHLLYGHIMELSNMLIQKKHLEDDIAYIR